MNVTACTDFNPTTVHSWLYFLIEQTVREMKLETNFTSFKAQTAVLDDSVLLAIASHSIKKVPMERFLQ